MPRPADARNTANRGRVDSDVQDWPRGQGPAYQTTINRILRKRMETDRRE